MRAVAEALVIVSFGFEQLIVVGFAVDVSVKRGKIPETKKRKKMFLLF